MKKMLLLVGVLGCASVQTSPAYVTPILAMDPPNGAYGRTFCSWNNQPVIQVQPAILESSDAAIIIAHERVHARRMLAYKGGCWPYVYRYQKDTAFQRKEQLLAYCESGKLAIEMNKNPESMWEHIKGVMQQFHGLTLSEKDNCLYEGAGK